MKLNPLIFVAVISMATHAGAATYVFNNGSGTATHGIVDSSGNSFRSGTMPGQVVSASGDFGTWTSAGAGVVSVGFFTTDNLEGLDQSSLIGAFNAFGAPGTFGAGPAGQRGAFSLSPASSIIAGSDFAEQSMYLFAGNGTTFEDSTEFLVLKNSATFNAADDAVPTAITIQFNPGNSEVLYGILIADVRTTNADSTVTPGWQMIPEPSTALLGALGALGLLRRRRTKI